MSTARPSQTLTRRLLLQPSASRTIPSHATSSTPLAATCHHFHTSAPRLARRPRFSSVKAETLGLTNKQKVDEYVKEKFPRYSPEELKGLQDVYKYTPEQMQAVRAAELAVGARDMAMQGRIREDKARLPYLDDFSIVRPILDPKPEQQLEAEDYKFLDEQEFIDKFFEKTMQKTTENMEEAAAAAFRASMERVKATDGLEIDLTTKELEDIKTWPELREKFVMSEEEEEMKPSALKRQDEATAAEERVFTAEDTRRILQELINDFSKKVEPKENNATETWQDDERFNIYKSGEAPPLGKVPGVGAQYNRVTDPDDEGLDEEGFYQNLKKATGMSVRDILSIFTKVLVTRAVVNQTRLGKVRSASIMVIAGNGNGRLGLGIAKSADFPTATMAARLLAIRNMRPIRRYENRTIYGTVREKISGTIVELRARPPGMFHLLSPLHIPACKQAKLTILQASVSASRPASSKCAVLPASTTSRPSSPARAIL